MRSSEWHVLHTSWYTWKPRRIAAWSNVLNHLLCSHGYARGGRPSSDKLALSDSMNGHSPYICWYHITEPSAMAVAATAEVRDVSGDVAFVCARVDAKRT